MSYLKQKQEEQVFEISITLPGGVVKTFRTDEWNEEVVIKRFEKEYGANNINITRSDISSYKGI